MAIIDLVNSYEMAVIHQRDGRLAEAESIYRQILSTHPEIAEVHNNLGVALSDQGRCDEAGAEFRQALSLRPDFAEAWNNLGNVLRQSGAMTDAIAAFRRSIELSPDFIKPIENLGLLYDETFQPDLALSLFRRYVELRPGDAHGHYNLANALRDLSQIDPAIDAYRTAIALHPQYVEAHHNLAGVLKDAGRLDDALCEFNCALELRPNAFTARNVLCTLHFHPGYDARRLYAAHSDWNARYAQGLAPTAPSYSNAAIPERRLRIGYVSPDLREHPIGRFMLPLLAHHDKTQFEIYCYTDVRRTDDLTDALKSHVNVWQRTSNLNDEELAGLIRSDQIDILIDLTMHMKGSRLLVFARKPAPVQVTYLAYCSTTGLKAIDYRLSDPYLDPPGMDETVYSEQTVRLRRTYWCYPRPECGLGAGPLPSASAGHVTFGCLNNYCKVTSVTLSMWRDLLAKVPGSRLIIHALEGRHRQDALDFFAGASVEPHRIEFVGQLPLKDYLSQYYRIDIALDPFPYGGGTTTCDALYMGVPVVTLKGDTAVSRGGASILTNLGHNELIANTRDQYLEIAAGLANNRALLSELRSTLPSQMEASPLMDATAFARDIEGAFRKMWADWCAGHSMSIGP